MGVKFGASLYGKEHKMRLLENRTLDENIWTKVGGWIKVHSWLYDVH
jgi:hypothetical protein